MKFIDKILKTKKEVEQELKRVFADDHTQENKETLSKEIAKSFKKKSVQEQATEVVVEEKETLDAFSLSRRK